MKTPQPSAPAPSASPMRTPSQVAGRMILIASALLLPSLSLLPLGGLYLWEKGYLLWWGLGSLVTVGLILLLERRLIWPATPLSAGSDGVTGQTHLYSPREEDAWRDVLAISARIEPDKLSSQQAVIDLGLETVEAVARRLHPEKDDALWQFTMPEALAITERVSRRLAGYVASHIPFGDRLTLSNFISVYRWRGALGMAERAYDVWRILRLANPVTAATNEARERLSRALMQYGREHVTRQLAAGFVEEVGRAAIDLYGGRLRVAGPSSAAESMAGRPPGTAAGEPVLDVLVIAATADAAAILAADVAVIDDVSEGRLPRLLPRVPVPGSDPTAVDDDLLEALNAADLVLWQVDGKAGGSAPGRATVAAFAERVAARSDVIAPVVIPLLTGTGALPDDTLMPPVSIPLRPPVAVSLADEAREERQQRLAAAIAEAEHTAQRVRYLRFLDGSRQGRSWWKSGRQAATATFNLARSAIARRERADRQGGE